MSESAFTCPRFFCLLARKEPNERSTMSRHSSTGRSVSRLSTYTHTHTHTTHTHNTQHTHTHTHTHTQHTTHTHHSIIRGKLGSEHVWILPHQGERLGRALPPGAHHY